MGSVDPDLDWEAVRACDIATLDVPGTVQATQRVRHLRGFLDAFEAQLTSHMNSLYEQGRGAPAADVLTRNQGVSAAEARRKERRAKLLDQARAFGDALAAGAVGAEHADVLANVTAKLDDSTKTALFDREDALLDRAKSSSPEEFQRHCRDVINRLHKDQGVERAERQRRETRVSRRIDGDGMHHLTGVFHPELGAAIWTVMDAEIAARVSAGGERELDRQVLAAEVLAEFVIGAHQQIRPVEAEIKVTVDLDTLLHGLHEHSLCEYDDGIQLPPATLRRLCCQGRLIPIVLNGDGIPVDVGREQRLATRAQRRALRTMYRTCAFPGCDVPFERCEIHHLELFELGGRTDLDNLLPACCRHHHLVHEGGWRLELAWDRRLTVRQPDGSIYATVPLQIPPATRQHRERVDLCQRARQRLAELRWPDERQPADREPGDQELAAALSA